MEAAKNPEATTDEGNEKIAPSKQRYCDSCGKSGSDLSRCSRCKKVYYCDVQCQRKHYPDHKKNCQPEQTTQSSKALPSANEQLQPLPNKASIDDFEQMEFVGRGNFSEIFRAKSKLDGKVWALKQIDKSKLKRLEKEADVLMEKHCLQKLKGWPLAVQIEKTFQDEISLYIQMEFPQGGELWNQCRTFGLMSESLTKHFFCHIFRAVEQLHNTFEIVHRDLKPENVLLTKDNHIRLIDFGTAKDLSRPDLKGSGNGSRRRKVFEHYVGTPNYMAPECIHNKASEKACDVYSLAGVFYFLKTGHPPFTGGSEYLIFKKVLESLPYLPDSIFSKVEQDLFLKMMDKDWAARPSLVELSKHDYFKDVDLTNLPTYQQASACITAEEKYLMALKNQMLKHADRFDSPSEERQQLWKETLRPQLDDLRRNIPPGLHSQQLCKGIQRIKLGVYNMLNISEDSNVGFEELHHKYCQEYDL